MIFKIIILDVKFTAGVLEHPSAQENLSLKFKASQGSQGKRAHNTLNSVL